MPCELMKFVIAFAGLFSKPIFNHVKVLLTGAILSPGWLTGANALRVMGSNGEKHFQNYHRVSNRAVWISPDSSRILLDLPIKAFQAGSELVIGFDDTIESAGQEDQGTWNLSGCSQVEQIVFR